MGRHIPPIILDKDEINLFLDGLVVDESAVIGYGVGVDGVGLRFHFLDSALCHKAVIDKLIDESVKLGACDLTLGDKVILYLKGIALIIFVALYVEGLGSIIYRLGKGFVVVFEKLLISASPLGRECENIVLEAKLGEKRVVAGNRLGVDGIGGGIVYEALLNGCFHRLVCTCNESKNSKHEC